MTDRGEIVVAVPAQAPLPVDGQDVGFDHDQAQTLCGDEGLAKLVIAGALLASVDAADGQSVGLVKVRDRLAVLAFVVLDHEAVLGPVSVNRERRAAVVGTRVAAQPVEPVLPRPFSIEDLVAQVEDVRFVAVRAAHNLSMPGRHSDRGPCSASNMGVALEGPFVGGRRHCLTGTVSSHRPQPPFPCS